MDTNKSKIDQLLQQYKEGNCSPEEIAWLKAELSDADNDAAIDAALVASLLEPSFATENREAQLEKTLENIKKQILATEPIPREQTEEEPVLADIPPVRRSRFRAIWPYWAAAAAVLLVFSLFLWTPRRGPSEEQLMAGSGRDTSEELVLPGGNKATLRLADGSLVQLNDKAAGIIMGDEIRYDNGQAIAGGKQDQAAADPSKVLLELSTPEGGMYHITLPDGTKVWLNAASSLKYPVRFAQNERKVFVEGEAFFEVTKDASRPFKVRSSGQDIEVLGTSFNVNAYPENTTIRTTLITGKVKLYNDGKSSGPVYLQPGQQSSNDQGNIKVKQVDTAPFIAWKEGLFYFEETPMEEALQQIGRWYNVAVNYSSGIPQTHFYGRIKRNKPLHEVLEILAEGGLYFKLDKSQGKQTLQVSPADQR